MCYLERAIEDGSGITVELLDGISQVPNRSPNSKVVPMHQHHAYELTLILRGNCEHSYRGTTTPLIPGDMFLIPPEQPHAFSFRDNICFCNCQFEADILKGFPAAMLRDMAFVERPQSSLAEKRARDLRVLEQGRELGTEPALLRGGNVEVQGIIHLSRAEMETVSSVIKNILQEQREQKFAFEQMKQNLLEQLLMLVRRAMLQQVDRTSHQASWKDELADAVITRIDENLAREVDFEVIAQQQGITMSYFRMIFKSVTGFSPTEYLGRVRVLHVLELLQTTDAPVAEIAMAVGIFDANYFSRLFKKIVGYPPSYFKAISPHLDAAQEVK